MREAKASQIYSAIQTGMKLGMQTMEQTLAQMVINGTVSFEEAISKSAKPDELQRLVSGAAATLNKAKLR
jgi:twitching motility protein PilT